MPVAQMELQHTTASEGSTKRAYYLQNVASRESSPEYKLPITTHGDLKFLRVSCKSANFSISLRNKEGVEAGSNFEIFAYSGINKSYGTKGDESVRLGLNELNIPYVNADSPKQPYLYLVVTNDDVLPTDIITVELVVKEQ